MDEALICQLQASDQWALYQAKGIKSGVLRASRNCLPPSGKPAPASDKSVEKYAEEQKEIQVEAKKLEEERTVHLEHHEKLATAVTMFQICIAVSAISVLTGRRTFWFVSLAAGAGGGVSTWPADCSSVDPRAAMSHLPGLDDDADVDPSPRERPPRLYPDLWPSPAYRVRQFARSLPPARREEVARRPRFWSMPHLRLVPADPVARVDLQSCST